MRKLEQISPISLDEMATFINRHGTNLVQRGAMTVLLRIIVEYRISQDVRCNFLNGKLKCTIQITIHLNDNRF